MKSYSPLQRFYFLSGHFIHVEPQHAEPHALPFAWVGTCLICHVAMRHLQAEA